MDYLGSTLKSNVCFLELFSYSRYSLINACILSLILLTFFSLLHAWHYIRRVELLHSSNIDFKCYTQTSISSEGLSLGICIHIKTKKLKTAAISKVIL